MAPGDEQAAELGELARRIEGELEVSSLARRLYSQDASIYEERPLGVVRPRHAEDCAAVVRFAAERGLPLIPRGGGTSLAGQCVGGGLVIDCSRHMNRILSLDPETRTAVVEPGVVQDDLNDAAAPHGLHFAPDTSTSRQANIGGMIGNNSGGSYSALHGMTREHTVSVKAVLADGSAAVFGPLSDDERATKCRQAGAEGNIYRAVIDLVGSHRDLIRARFPDPAVLRRNMGYALDALLDGCPWNPDGPPFNLARLLCGSEGTLALVTEAAVRLTPRPAHRMLICAHFFTVTEACRAVPDILRHRPAAIELMDGALLEATRRNREQAANRFWIHGQPGGVLAIELQAGTRDELEARGNALCDYLRGRGFGYAHAVIGASDIARVWALRKAGLGLYTGIPGDRKPATGLEDAAVPPSRLAEFVEAAEALMKRFGLEAVCYGHASVGLLHLRPMLNLKDPAAVKLYAALMDEMAGLVKQFGGCLSGEHGDGRLRAPYIERMMGPEMVELFLRVKDAFDPRGLLNPGKIVKARPLLENLRVHPGAADPAFPTVYDWSARAGFVCAVEACNGVGQCRQRAGRGTMCPTYMATGEESHTTRGRANVLRQVLAAGDKDGAWTDPDVAAVMDTCVSCKGCATECPSSVDLARIKGEWLQKRLDLEGATLRSWCMGHYGSLARMASRMPRLVSAVMNAAPVRGVLGVASKRRLPAFAREPLGAWFRRRGSNARDGSRGEVALFADEFTAYTEPEIGWAAVDVLEAAAWRVTLVEGVDSARALISKGFLRAARRVMARAVRTLAPLADRGVDILGLEPSALLGFRDEAPDLVPPELRDEARRVAGRVLLFEEFVAREARAGRLDGLALRALPAKQVLVHGHCHQKALAGSRPLLEALSLIPDLAITEIPSGCCGMAGSFGYEAEHYELSMRIGEATLFPAVRAQPDALVCAPGTSCRHQLRDATGRRAEHPAVLLRRALACRA